jgi:hypothetical protein
MGKEDNPMRFLVQIEAYETLVGRDADRLIRDTAGQRLSQVMETGKIKEFGFLADRRGAFFLVDIDEAEELYDIFGPEVYGHFRVQASPVAPVEKVGPLFEQWAQEGR